MQTKAPVTAQRSVLPELKTSEIVGILLIAGLGFLVDIYDLVVFAVVRIPSLKALAVPDEQLLSTGVFLLNMQMVGMILGGFIWGILGDKKGRKAALFGSIIIYSIANLANGFVTSVPLYALIRVLAGIGLAGEVGAAMTIAAEVTPAKYRSYGTAAVAGVAVSGAIIASYVADLLPWRTAFITAGVLGLLVLFARVSLKETPMFARIQNTSVPRGSLKVLLGDRKRFWRLVRCALTAVPLWFVFGVIVSFAPEICRASSSTAAAVSVAAAALSYSLGETTGEIGSGVLSQWLKSRKKAMLVFLGAAAGLTLVALHSPPSVYQWLCIPLGFSVGYWSVAITTTAEQFGTNIRSTATTLAPNLVRASAIPVTLGFSALAATIGPSNSALIVGGVCFLLAAVSILMMDETFAKDLDFVEV